MLTVMVLCVLVVLCVQIETIAANGSCAEATLDGKGFTLVEEFWVCNDSPIAEPPPTYCPDGKCLGQRTLLRATFYCCDLCQVVFCKFRFR